MIKFTIVSFCLLALGCNYCLAQTVDDSQVITNDVHLSVAVITNVFQSGSSSICVSTLLNSSTNIIEIDPASPNTQPSQLEIFLTDETGKFLPPDPDAFGVVWTASNYKNQPR